MQAVAWLMAHRALLAFLMRKIAALDPKEATLLDQTATMLRNSMPPLFANQPEPLRSQLIAMAEQEIDRILIAPAREVPPHPQS